MNNVQGGHFVSRDLASLISYAANHWTGLESFYTLRYAISMQQLFREFSSLSGASLMQVDC